MILFSFEKKQKSVTTNKVTRIQWVPHVYAKITSALPWTALKREKSKCLPESKVYVTIQPCQLLVLNHFICHFIQIWHIYVYIRQATELRAQLIKLVDPYFFSRRNYWNRLLSPVYLRIIDTGSRIKHWRGRKKWITNKAMKRPVNICPFAIAFRYPDNEYVFSPRVCPIHPPFQTYSSRLLSKITGAVAHSNIEMIPGETMYISFRATPLPSRAPPSTKILI